MAERDQIEASLCRAQESLQRIRIAEQGGDSDIQTLFKGSVVFITGGTGFVGKQLLEKLLRSCPGIQKVYLLMRSKKGKTIAERLETQLNDPVYDLLRSIDPEFSKRVFPINGDVTELKLGIHDNVWNRIKLEINFIFHIAAAIHFNSPLKQAVLNNVRGTKELLDLANGVLNLKALVHFSSAFANSNRMEVYEIFYSTPINPELLIEMAETLDDAKFEAIGQILIEGWANAYTFSKALAENMVKKARHLPVCVVRPAMITPAFQEPTRGWIDKRALYGPNGILVGIDIGVLHSLYASRECDYDLVPLDFVNNLAITAAWSTACRGVSEREPMIYTCSRKRNPLKCSQLHELLLHLVRKQPSPKALWCCYTITTTRDWLFKLNTVLFHFTPALLVDAVLICVGRKPRLTKAYRVAYTMNRLLGHFLNNTWIFHDNNTVEVQKKMSNIDKEIFPFEITNIDHHDYVRSWRFGTRKFIINDSATDSKMAATRQKWLKVSNCLFMCVFGFGLWCNVKGLFSLCKYCLRLIAKISEKVSLAFWSARLIA